MIGKIYDEFSVEINDLSFSFLEKRKTEISQQKVFYVSTPSISDNDRKYWVFVGFKAVFCNWKIVSCFSEFRSVSCTGIDGAVTNSIRKLTNVPRGTNGENKDD